MDDTERQRKIQERLQRRNEYLRTKSLKDEILASMAESLEGAQTPVIVFKNYEIVYANPSALRATQYSFEQISTFNNFELDTGTSKKRLNHILESSSQLGLNAIEFETQIPTLDHLVLQMTPQLHRLSSKSSNYWVGELRDVSKIDPTSIKSRVYGWLNRLFQRNAVSLRAPELVYKAFAGEVVKNIADHTKNVLIDFSQTRYIEEGALDIIKGCCDNELFTQQLFLTTSNPETYHWLRFKNIPERSMYLPKGLLEGAKA